MAENPYSSPKASPAAMVHNRAPSRRFGRLYAIAAASFAAGFFWTRHAARVAVEEAIRDYGHNVDSGAWLATIGSLYFLPAAFIFSVASIAMFRAWRFRPAFHLIAWAWAASPFLFVLASLLRRAVAA
jgi:hypothetical protein